MPRAEFLQSEGEADPVSSAALREGRAKFQLDRGIDLTVFVTDADEEAIAGANVTLWREGSLLNQAGITDERGRFSFVAIEVGGGQLLVRAPGYAPRLVGVRH
jgi:hypothetical protein